MVRGKRPYVKAAPSAELCHRMWQAMEEGREYTADDLINLTRQKLETRIDRKEAISAMGRLIRLSAIDATHADGISVYRRKQEGGK